MFVFRRRRLAIAAGRFQRVVRGGGMRWFILCEVLQIDGLTLATPYKAVGER